DAAHKLTILASIAFGIPLQYNQVYVEGISALEQDDVEYATELGYRIKHLGIAKRVDEGIELRVHPTLIPERRLIANVDGVMNAILVKGDAVGPTLYYGAGAGAEPTASAVVADIVDVTRTLTSDPHNRVPHLAFQPGSLGSPEILPVERSETAYYLRMNAVNRPGVLAEVTRIFGDLKISIESILQKDRGDHESVVPIIILTQHTKEFRLDQALVELEKLDNVNGKIVRIRVETLK
ncbi:MAG: homoserine dehydrogenase, partial [Arenicellales bacterium]|nr:homoserine dehydrogenase [Arenicellales bacterium]